MTKHTVFITPGNLDLACLTTFGVSVKNTSTAIGRFGTGLKYALAVLMREEASIFLTTDGVTYEVKSSEVIIRDKKFLRGYLASSQGLIQLPFTTELGKDWELWQAFREIYSNTLDENGTLMTGFVPSAVPIGMTYITVIHDEFAEIAENKHEYFKEDKSDALVSGSIGHIYPGQSSNALFYQGIRVAELNQPTINTYDVARSGSAYLELTEDRTVKYSWEIKNNITHLILGCRDVEVIRKAITAPYTTYEYGLDFLEDSRGKPDPTPEFFLAVSEECNNLAVNKTAVELWETAQPLRNRFTNDSALDEFELIRIRNILEVIAVQMSVPGALNYEIIPAATLPTGTKSLQDPGENVIIVDSMLIRQDPLGYELAKVLTEAVFQLEKANPIESLLELCGFQKGKIAEDFDDSYIPF